MVSAGTSSRAEHLPKWGGGWSGRPETHGPRRDSTRTEIAWLGNMNERLPCLGDSWWGSEETQAGPGGDPSGASPLHQLGFTQAGFQSQACLVPRFLHLNSVIHARTFLSTGRQEATGRVGRTTYV